MNRDARLLAMAGVILLMASLINGFLIHLLPHGHQTLASHLIGLIGAGLLIALASLWPNLAQEPRTSRAAAFLGIYGFCAGWFINFIAAITGHFGLFPISTSVTPGKGLGDAIISIGLISVALTLLVLSVLIVRGLLRDRS